MRHGRLKHYITLQRKEVSTSPSGQRSETWSVLKRMHASVEPVGGDERFSQPQYVAREQVEFLVRYQARAADLSPNDRVVFPAVRDPAAPIPNGIIYDIVAVHVVGRRREIRILAARRADT
jgi:SPP1 family predicted phage head-tail adaptor